VYQRVMLGIQKKVALSGPIARFVFYTAFAIQQKAIESGASCFQLVSASFCTYRELTVLLLFRFHDRPFEQDCLC
jgi:long-subunit acyl-CoA synthetase (AMP-forming)